MNALNLDNDALEELMLNKAKLWLDEGYIFGNGGSGFERFNVACPRSTLEKALLQLRDAVYEVKGNA
jgi:cystathionine beta-lyase